MSNKEISLNIKERFQCVITVYYTYERECRYFTEIFHTAKYVYVYNNADILISLKKSIESNFYQYLPYIPDVVRCNLSYFCRCC